MSQQPWIAGGIHLLNTQRGISNKLGVRSSQVALAIFFSNTEGGNSNTFWGRRPTAVQHWWWQSQVDGVLFSNTEGDYSNTFWGSRSTAVQHWWWQSQVDGDSFLNTEGGNSNTFWGWRLTAVQCHGDSLNFQTQSRVNSNTFWGWWSTVVINDLVVE